MTYVGRAPAVTRHVLRMTYLDRLGRIATFRVAAAQGP